MRHYLVKTPRIVQRFFHNYSWRIKTSKKEIYLTFDDGPVPDFTPWVLKTLDDFGAKATFFCVGDNAKRHPELIQEILAAGHTVGNHTMNHLDGWATDNLPYFHNIRHCAEEIDSTLFRPPYGRIRPRQAQFLQRHYEIVMWDVLSGDFDPHLSPEDCLRNVVRNAQPGSIVVFHDSLKAQEKLEFALPQVLAHFRELGYNFAALTPELLSNKRVLQARPKLRTA